MKDYIRRNEKELKCRTELSKIYQHQKKWKEAEEGLLECLKIRPDDLNSRTELSKIYQQQFRMDEAEKILRECLEINSDDLNSLLELGKICSRDFKRFTEAEQFFERLLLVEPDNLFARTELAALYYKMKRHRERESILFQIYQTHPEDILTLVMLARVFRRFRKYRVALRLLESALKLRDWDVLTLIELIYIHSALRDWKSVRRYIERGREVLEKDRYNRHRDRFDQLYLNIDERVSLLNLYEVGVMLRDGDEWFVESESGRFLLTDQTTVNYRLNENDRVFFATYAGDGQVFADFVEPHFDNIDHLDKLR